jgi:hypothetical protein
MHTPALWPAPLLPAGTATAALLTGRCRPAPCLACPCPAQRGPWDYVFHPIGGVRAWPSSRATPKVGPRPAAAAANSTQHSQQRGDMLLVPKTWPGGGRAVKHRISGRPLYCWKVLQVSHCASCDDQCVCPFLVHILSVREFTALSDAAGASHCSQGFLAIQEGHASLQVTVTVRLCAAANSSTAPLTAPVLRVPSMHTAGWGQHGSQAANLKSPRSIPRSCRP